MKKDNSKPMTPEQTAELAALAALTDHQINTRDVPEQKNWSDARRDLFFRPIKRQLTLRLDADVIDWFKIHPPNGEGYSTSINSALREYVSQHGGDKNTLHFSKPYNQAYPRRSRGIRAPRKGTAPARMCRRQAAPL